MVYLIENEVAVMGNRPSINVVCRRLFTSELNKNGFHGNTNTK